MDSLPSNEATQSAVEAPSDQDLRVPCYCEENVYRLVSRKLVGATRTNSVQYYVVFVSSEMQCVPMCYQLAAKTPTSICVWDYHVIVLQVSEDGSCHVLDMDSHLPYPCPLETYVQYSFPDQLPVHYAPLFRVVRAETFLQCFYSDRKHMIKDDGTWSAVPPTYRCIQTEEGSNLDNYRIMTWKVDNASPVDDDIFEKNYGAVLNRLQFLRYFWKRDKK
jgi:protein N-terminal glutamine amidohydrolase